MKKLLLFIFLLLTLSIYAQVKVDGKVTMSDTNEAVSYAEVSSLENPKESVLTDEKGHFSIELTKESGKIQILTMENLLKIVDYKGNQTIDIKLERTKIQLDEIVAIGYGSVSKADLTTSVSSIENVEQISSRPVASVGEFLQGQAPGVTVTQQGGDPTQLPRINIRGIGTTNYQDVLYVVDGLPYYGPPINPNDIKNISILKDAAASSIYGAQASGGVIIIETKTGRKGKPQIEFNIFTGFQKVSNLPTPLTAEERNQVYKTAYQNDGKLDKLPDAYDATKNPWGAVTRTNWMEEIFRAAAVNGINTNFKGATDNVNYYTSLEYLKKDGTLLDTGFERYSARAKVDINLYENLKSGMNLVYSRTEARGTNTNSGYSGTIINALYMPSSAPVYDENGQFHGTVPYSLSAFSGAYGDIYNPVALLLRPTIKNPLNNFNAQGYLEYEPIKNLTLKTSIGYNYGNRHYKRFNPRIPEIGRSNKENFLYESYIGTNGWIWDNQINYNLNLSKNNIDFTLVHSAQEDNYQSFSQQGKNFDVEESYYQFMSFAGEIYRTKNNKYKTRMSSAIGRVMYDFDKRYYLSASIRRDKTSKANPEGNLQVGWFPSFSGAWRISNEDFFNSDFFSNLKLRGSWGKVANVSSLSPYSFTSQLRIGKVIIGEKGEEKDVGVWLDQRPSKNVTWEVTKSYDLGLDIELFKKISATFDYYNKTTEGIILRNTKEDHHGLSPEYINAGDVENRGIEASVNYKDQIGEIHFNVGANFATNSNEFIHLSDEYMRTGNEEIPVNQFNNIRGQLDPLRNKLHQEIFSYYLIPYEGIFQSQAEIDAHKAQPNAKPGDFKFRDVNGDGEITNEDRIFVGSYNPDFTYAFNVNLAYEGFDFSAFFQGVAGVDVFNAYKYSAYNTSNDFNLDKRALNAWTPNNTETNIPRLSHEDLNKNFSTNSTWYLEDGSYLRLRNITLGYDFSRFISKFSKKARIYISAENLFTITNYTGINPEVGGQGIDNGKYPVSRAVTLGASFNF